MQYINMRPDTMGKPCRMDRSREDDQRGDHRTGRSSAAEPPRRDSDSRGRSRLGAEGKDVQKARTREDARQARPDRADDSNR